MLCGEERSFCPLGEWAGMDCPLLSSNLYCIHRNAFYTSMCQNSNKWLWGTETVWKPLRKWALEKDVLGPTCWAAHFHCCWAEAWWHHHTTSPVVCHPVLYPVTVWGMALTNRSQMLGPNSNCTWVSTNSHPHPCGFNRGWNPYVKYLYPLPFKTFWSPNWVRGMNTPFQ